MTTGKVVFVGAGPGDPKLITVKGLELIKRADVIVHDRLASPKLLKDAKPDAELIYCGKAANRHSMVQEEINSVMVKEAKKGKLVVRLKGGDPCIFGRVGEEAEECVNQSIPFEVIPGITSGIAAPAFAGIPLTHRDYNDSVAIITGHHSTEKGHLNLQKVSAMETIVIYMGMKNLDDICQKLIHYGKDPTTPVALVRWGTTSQQETLVGDLMSIAQKAKNSQFHAPAIIVVGDVVRLRDQLNWYEGRVLFGKKVLLVSEPETPLNRIQQLEDLGAEVLTTPAYEGKVVEQQKWIELAGRGFRNFSWIILANPREAEFFFHFLRERRIDIRKVPANFFACGQATAEFLESKGIFPTIFIDDFDESNLVNILLEALPPETSGEVLVVDQDGAGMIKSEKIHHLSICQTSFYEKQYAPAQRFKQLVESEKIDLVILTHAAFPLAQLPLEVQSIVLTEDVHWTEGYVEQQMKKKELLSL